MPTLRDLGSSRDQRSAASERFSELLDKRINSGFLNMKDKIKDKGDALKGLIKTGGNVMDKALDKSSEVAALMIDNTTKLTSKLSDDIGIMADRILTMEQRIGNMADRIVHTEELMAKLAATLANKELDVAFARPSDQPGSGPALLYIDVDRIGTDAVPDLRISGDPQIYMLYVSSSPIFRDDSTIVSRVAKAGDLTVGWQRSVRSLFESRGKGEKGNAKPMVVSVAVRTAAGGGQLSPLSNSVDVTIC
jgi:hypothetical protein